MRALVTRIIPDEFYERCMFGCGLALYLAIIVFGSIPGARAEIDDVASGVVLHLAAYSCIAFLLASGTPGSLPRKAVVSFLIVAAMGAVDETIQSFLPYRHGTLSDWGIDLTAALLTTALYWLASARKSARRPALRP